MKRSSQKKAESGRLIMRTLLSRFIAYTFFDDTCRTSWTSPKAPRPINLMTSKSSGFIRRLTISLASSVSGNWINSISQGFVWNCTNSHRLLYASMFFNDFTGSRPQSAMRAVTVSRRLSTHAMLPGSRIRCSSSSNLQMFERLIKVSAY